MRGKNIANKLTLQILRALQEKGYRYVLVKGYTLDRQFDYIELSSFTLLPVKELPTDPAEKEIFEPLDSELLQEWAGSPDVGVAVYIDPSFSLR